MWSTANLFRAEGAIWSLQSFEIQMPFTIPGHFAKQFRDSEKILRASHYRYINFIYRK